MSSLYQKKSTIGFQKRAYFEEFAKILTERYREILAGPREEKIPISCEKELSEIRMALEKVEQGSYGICEACDELIPHQRLIRIPYTRHCVDCQREYELSLHRKKFRRLIET